jgi:hypothetical protein
MDRHEVERVADQRARQFSGENRRDHFHAGQTST